VNAIRSPILPKMCAGLSSAPKRLFPKYLYDELGSQLFEAICLLPEYYPTRAEKRNPDALCDEIVNLTGRPNTLIEMGSGSASKTRLLIEALLRSQPELLFVPVDISASALESSSRILLQSYRVCVSKLTPRSTSTGSKN